tara:strand:+ start:120 stop:350 length:231 start_codon:yes stop_codon:yes gene_type:complete
MLIELIKPTFFHLRTLPTPVGSVLEVDKWKGDELIANGDAIEYSEHPQIVKSKAKKIKVETKVEKTEPIEAHKTEE